MFEHPVHHPFVFLLLQRLPLVELFLTFGQSNQPPLPVPFH